MFLHHTMTDSEILRSCEGCTSSHLRLVADRLRDRVENLATIHRTALRISGSMYLVDVQAGVKEIIEESTPEGN